MAYKVTRVKDCDGNDVKNGEVTDEHVYSYFSFICMTDSPYSLVVKFPRDEKKSLQMVRMIYYRECQRSRGECSKDHRRRW